MSDSAQYVKVWTPRWWRWLGVASRDGDSYRCTWGEASTRGLGGIGLELQRRERRWTLHVAVPFLALWVRLGKAGEQMSEDPFGDSWGFSFPLSDGYSTLFLRWGAKSKLFWMPWDHGASIGSWTLSEDGKSWHPLPVCRIWLNGKLCRDDGSPEENTEGHVWPGLDSLRFSEPVRYRLSSGELQERTASVTVHRQEWRPRMTRWLPWPRHIYCGIWVEFSDEVGDGTGSWKGGTMGCGYELLPNESAASCLSRMMHERKFR
jgi:hypothetical protein